MVMAKWSGSGWRMVAAGARGEGEMGRRNSASTCLKLCAASLRRARRGGGQAAELGVGHGGGEALCQLVQPQCSARGRGPRL